VNDYKSYLSIHFFYIMSLDHLLAIAIIQSVTDSIEKLLASVLDYNRSKIQEVSMSIQ
jgi:hypothetical protein